MLPKNKKAVLHSKQKPKSAVMRRDYDKAAIYAKRHGTRHIPMPMN
jgi:hypothetical protein